MAATLQIITLVASFLLALLLGEIFDTGYFQAAIIAKAKSGDQPLPLISLMLSQNHRALIYVMLIPWIGFAGTPVFTRANQYFDRTSFLIRFAAFAAIEALLTVFLLLFLVLPFVPYYMLMDMRPNTITESVFILGFWIIVVVMLSLIFRRTITKRGKKPAEQDSDGKPDPASS